MQRILKELKTIKGGIGVYVYHAKNGIMAKNVPAVFKNPKLIQMGRTLIKIYSAGHMSFSDLSEASLFYEEAIVTIREIDEKYYLVVLFDPSAKINMLTMGINLVMDELSDIIRNSPKSDDIKTPDVIIRSTEAYETLPKILTEVYTLVNELGGKLSGEHGVGHKRKEYMGLVVDEAFMRTMRAIKKALDPNNILNPGKIFDL